MGLLLWMLVKSKNLLPSSKMFRRFPHLFYPKAFEKWISNLSRKQKKISSFIYIYIYIYIYIFVNMLLRLKRFSCQLKGVPNSKVIPKGHCRNNFFKNEKCHKLLSWHHCWIFLMLPYFSCYFKSLINVFIIIHYCIKSVQKTEFFWSVFYCIHTE